MLAQNYSAVVVPTVEDCWPVFPEGAPVTVSSGYFDESGDGALFMDTWSAVE